MELPPSPKDHAGCAAWLKNGLAAKGVDVNVSTLSPIFRSPYETNPFVCPHGTVHWIEPTPEQVAEWVRDGVE